MGRSIVATHHAVLNRDWLCQRCSAYGRVTVAAKGSGQRRVLWSRDDAEDAAHADAASSLESDVDRIIALVRCPACRERAPGAVLPTLWLVLPDLALGLVCGVMATAVIANLIDDKLVCILLGVAVMLAMVAIGDEPRRYRAAAKATLDVVASKRVREQARRATTRVAFESDPFRALPVPPPILVEQPRVKVATPIVPSDDVTPTFLN